VGESRYRLVKTREAIIGAVSWGAPLTVLIALCGGVALAMGYRRRIEEVNRSIHSIMEGNLARRVPMRGSGDEMDQLAGNLNAMLERIQSLMENVKRVSEDIAHDLRTPLSRLRQRLEGVLGPAASEADQRLALADSVAELDSILETFGALLRIAQVESGMRRSGFAQVDVGELCQTVAEIYAPIAEDRGQHLATAIQDGVHVCGDRDLLFQLLTNVVENAILHCPPGTCVALRVLRERGTVRLEIADSGPGIPPAEREKVFRRFYRLEASRTTPGNGLGLALVKAIGELHGASIALADNGPGLKVILQFPAANRSAPRQRQPATAVEG
jgi:signal transduction histidine kinase